MKRWSSKTQRFCETSFKNEALKLKNRFCETSFKNDMWTRHLASELQYILTTFQWMLQKYGACQATWCPQSNISVTWNLQPFQGFSVRDLKQRQRKPRNPGTCHAKSIILDLLQIHHACQCFCNPHKLLCLPRLLQRVEILAPTTRNAVLLTSSAADPPRTPFLGADFASLRSHKTREKRSILRNSYPPESHLSHLCCITSARSHLLVDRSSAATLSIVGS